VPEGRHIFPKLSVFNNLEMGAYLRSNRNFQREFQQDIDYVFQLFPILGERKKQKAGTLSGGEQQMLAIARALMSRPRLLMLDEPSVGLAPLIVRQIFETIRKLNDQGLTILLVEQEVEASLSISARGYVLQLGRVVLEGLGREILGTEEVKAIYLGKKAAQA
jgi:branched-chain amino acid transport system ATP-binding protein